MSGQTTAQAFANVRKSIVDGGNVGYIGSIESAYKEARRLEDQAQPFKSYVEYAGELFIRALGKHDPTLKFFDRSSNNWIDRVELHGDKGDQIVIHYSYSGCGSMDKDEVIVQLADVENYVKSLQFAEGVQEPIAVDGPTTLTIIKEVAARRLSERDEVERQKQAASNASDRDARRNLFLKLKGEFEPPLSQ